MKISNKTRNNLLYAALGGVVFCGVSFLLHLWFSLFSVETLWKIFVTSGVLVVIVGAIIIVKQFIDEEDSQRKDGFLN